MKTILLFLILVIFAVLLVVLGCTAKTYDVDYCGEMQMYEGAKASFVPGTTVTLYYTLIASDTDYTFYLDGEKLSVALDASKGFMIRFTMPDHNVKLECVAENTMTDSVTDVESIETT